MFNTIYDLLRYGIIKNKAGVEVNVCIDDAVPYNPTALALIRSLSRAMSS